MMWNFLLLTVSLVVVSGDDENITDITDTTETPDDDCNPEPDCGEDEDIEECGEDGDVEVEECGEDGDVEVEECGEDGDVEEPCGDDDIPVTQVEGCDDDITVEECDPDGVVEEVDDCDPVTTETPGPCDDNNQTTPETPGPCDDNNQTTPEPECEGDENITTGDCDDVTTETPGPCDDNNQTTPEPECEGDGNITTGDCDPVTTEVDDCDPVTTDDDCNPETPVDDCPISEEVLVNLNITNYKGGYDVQSVAENGESKSLKVKCPEGKQLVDKKTNKIMVPIVVSWNCTAGNWTDIVITEVPSCEAQCDTPPEDGKGIKNTDWYSGQEIEYFCETGWSTVDKETNETKTGIVKKICEDGTWKTESDITCKRMCINVCGFGFKLKNDHEKTEVEIYAQRQNECCERDSTPFIITGLAVLAGTIVTGIVYNFGYEWQPTAGHTCKDYWAEKGCGDDFIQNENQRETSLDGMVLTEAKAKCCTHGRTCRYRQHICGEDSFPDKSKFETSVIDSDGSNMDESKIKDKCCTSECTKTQFPEQGFHKSLCFNNQYCIGGHCCPNEENDATTSVHFCPKMFPVKCRYTVQGKEMLVCRLTEGECTKLNGGKVVYTEIDVCGQSDDSKTSENNSAPQRFLVVSNNL